jgi:surfeit locus 1 family protein
VQPRWLGLLAVVLVLCVAFGWLGHWQLDVARSGEHKKHQVTPAAVPIDQVAKAQQVFRGNMVGRPVTVTGTYDATRQLLVSGKAQAGAKGFWVLTALRTPSGALVPVVRGFVSSAAAAAAAPPPTGPISLAGTLEPPDATPNDGDGPNQAPGQIPAADTADVVNLWGGPIYNVLLYAVSPADPALQPVPAPPPDTGGGLRLQNAAYAVQWWVFGAFALLLWWRMVRQDAVEAAVAALAGPTDRTKGLSTP